MNISDLIINVLSYFNEKILFFYICNQWEYIIREFLWTPNKIIKKTWFYWKIPFFHSIKRVNIKRKIVYMNAHSFREHSEQIIPYNLSIDCTIEYKIINPLIIYYINDIDDYVRNKWHFLIQEKINNSDITDLKIHFNNFIQENIEENTTIKSELIKEHNYLQNNPDKWIKIEDITIISYDNIISHRSTN